MSASITQSQTVEVATVAKRNDRKSGRIRSGDVLVHDEGDVKRAYVSRAAAARMLGCCAMTITRMHKRGEIPGTIIDDDGVHRYPIEVLDSLKMTTKSTTTTTMPFDPTRASGPTAGRIFRRFNEGASALDLVIELQLEPIVVRRLHAEWMQLRGMVTLDPSQYRVVMSVVESLGITTSVKVGGGIDSTTLLADDFVKAMRKLADDVVRRDSIVCEVCVACAVPNPKRALRCREHGRPMTKA